MFKKTLPSLSLPLLLAGCATQFTNLTPLQQARTTNNLYTVEVAFDSTQQTIRWDSIQPKIVVDSQAYDMRPTKLMTNRWEGVIPVRPEASSVHYRYKFDFKYNRMGKPGNDSALSHEYTLKVTEQ